MLKGEFGECTAKAMEILVKLGEAYDAVRMVKISSAHIADLVQETIGDSGIAFIEDLADKGASVRVFTTTNVTGIDRRSWKKFGIYDADYVTKELKILQALRKIGCTNTCSCTPYYFSNLPRFHEHVAWSESSTVPFVNSVLGARSNREGCLSALMAALTGRTPLYGYHLKENRLGEVLVEVRKEPKGTHEFGILGYHVGQIVVDKVPVFSGLSQEIYTEDLVELGSGLATSGGVGMYHIPNVTPETKTEQRTLRKEKPEETVEIEERELKETCKKLCTGSGKVDLVALGCPHYSLRQVERVAKLVEGKRIHEDVRLWIQTCEAVYTMAARAGYVDVAKKAGGLVTVDTCASALGPLLRRALGKLTIATDSAKQAFYLGPGRGWHNTLLGSTEDCIEAAVKGTWKE
jgi:hypothetical protein